ncbi:MAG: tetratricopeptide repeat protein, partial [Candidatus Riflebacteria bacterium]|nr:tetratricopeptide repeat protein [Candidatus Riflebacteria bacterium]
MKSTLDAAVVALLLGSLSVAWCAPAEWEASVRKGCEALRAGRYGEARDLLTRAVKEGVRAGGDETRLAVATRELAAAHLALSNPDKAKGLLRQALPILERRTGPESAQVGETLRVLGECLRQLERYDEAERLLVQAHRILARARPSDHGLIAATLTSLGALKVATGQFAKAEELLTKARRLQEAKSGDPGGLSDVLDELGLLFLVMQRSREAQKTLESALTLRKKVYGESHLKVADTLNRLGALHYSLQQPVEDCAYHLAALTIREQTLPPDHPDVG